jgi:hypothetical protein
MTKYRKDYKPTPFLISNVHLDFIINEVVTHVHSKLQVKSNPAHVQNGSGRPAMVLDGRKDVTLVSVK